MIVSIVITKKCKTGVRNHHDAYDKLYTYSRKWTSLQAQLCPHDNHPLPHLLMPLLQPT